jgi:hypothetical protein
MAKAPIFSGAFLLPYFNCIGWRLTNTPRECAGLTRDLVFRGLTGLAGVETGG